MASFLPGDWDSGQKTGFLSWLAGPASLLNERTDHTLAFTHLSFQEFLAAWNRSRVLEGDDRTAFATEKAETTRLWATLVEGQQGRETLEPVLKNSSNPTPAPPLRAPCSLMVSEPSPSSSAGRLTSPCVSGLNTLTPP